MQPVMDIGVAFTLKIYKDKKGGEKVKILHFFVEIFSPFLYNKNIDRTEKIVVLRAGGNYGRTV